MCRFGKFLAQLPRLALRGHTQRTVPGRHGGAAGWGCPGPCSSLWVHPGDTGKAGGSQPTEGEPHQGDKTGPERHKKVQGMIHLPPDTNLQPFLQTARLCTVWVGFGASSSHPLPRPGCVRLVSSVSLPLLELRPAPWDLSCSCSFAAARGWVTRCWVMPEGSTTRLVTHTRASGRWMPLPRLGGPGRAAAEQPPPVPGRPLQLSLLIPGGST